MRDRAANLCAAACATALAMAPSLARAQSAPTVAAQPSPPPSAPAPSPSAPASPSGAVVGGVSGNERGPVERAATGAGRAVVHYERSRAYYAAGRYRASIVELETAIRLDPSGTNLYFDLGLLYERVGRIDRALEAYRTYLLRTADPVERERAERILRRLAGAQDELRDLYQTRTGRADALFWGMVSGSVAGLVTGGAVLFSAVRASAEVDRLRMAGASEGTVNDAASAAVAQHVVGDTLLLAGVGLGATAVALYFTREAPPRSAPICITASAQGLGLTLGGSF